MFYDAQMHFLRSTLRKRHINTNLISPNDSISDNIDMGLRHLLGLQNDNKRFCDYFDIKENTIYKITDALKCKYIFFMLSDTVAPTLLVIGPYVTNEFTNKQILENSEKSGLSPRNIKELENYLNNIPIISDELFIHSLVDTFGECIWGNNFNYLNVNKDNSAAFASITLKETETNNKNRDWNIQIMEKRYAFENELMQAVSQGLTHKAELLIASINSSYFEKRVADSLRNIKNYCIILNTLLRKAAEKGKVHPVYIDSISSSYAQRIEALSSNENISEFMAEMFRSYCKLVKKYSISMYSAVVQKTIIYIDADLTADLSLCTLAEINNVSASYLSTLFKKETGETLTDFVNGRRIKQAKNLLKTTNLQIQTVAQHCGILDVHYFSKMFKKYVGLTPKAYREKK